jgi:MAF protein
LCYNRAMIGQAKRIVLASASPRRRRLLADLGVEYELLVPDVDENGVSAATPRELAEARALLKAEAAAAAIEEGIAIGADTIVVCDGRVLGKPKDEDDAVRLLETLSGRTHVVITGVGLCEAGTGRRLVDSAETRVTFRRLARDEIERYVATGEPMDKAGAYGIQSKGALLVEGIVGDYFNVVGLPLVLLDRMLREFGVRLL